MPKFAANLTMMFTEWPFLDRFDAAADFGFTAVEYLFPYAASARSDCRAACQKWADAGAVQPATWRLVGGRARAGRLPGRLDGIMAGTERALAYAEATGAKRLHLMSGLGQSK